MKKESTSTDALPAGPVAGPVGIREELQLALVVLVVVLLVPVAFLGLALLNLLLVLFLVFLLLRFFSLLLAFLLLLCLSCQLFQFCLELGTLGPYEP